MTELQVLPRPPLKRTMEKFQVIYYSEDIWRKKSNRFSEAAKHFFSGPVIKDKIICLSELFASSFGQLKKKKIRGPLIAQGWG